MCCVHIRGFLQRKLSDCNSTLTPHRGWDGQPLAPHPMVVGPAQAQEQLSHLHLLESQFLLLACLWSKLKGVAGSCLSQRLRVFPVNLKSGCRCGARDWEGQTPFLSAPHPSLAASVSCSTAGCSLCLSPDALTQGPSSWILRRQCRDSGKAEFACHLTQGWLGDTDPRCLPCTPPPQGHCMPPPPPHCAGELCGDRSAH